MAENDDYYQVRQWQLTRLEKECIETDKTLEGDDDKLRTLGQMPAALEHASGLEHSWMSFRMHVLRALWFLNKEVDGDK